MKGQNFKHIGYFFHGVLLLVTLNLSNLAWAKKTDIGRAPANFVPDDDLIEVPIVVEKPFLDEMNKENQRSFTEARARIEEWQIKEEMAIDHGLINRGFVRLPTQEQKQNFVQRNYLRFVTQRIERSSNEGLAEAWEEWNTDDEIDSIKHYEENEGYIIKAKKERGGSTNLDKTKEVNVGKDKFKFNFQPRLEMGMAKIQIDTPYFGVKAWVGVNGNQEIMLHRNFKKTNTQMLSTYYIDQGRLLAAVDQDLSKNWSLRLSHDKQLQDTDSSDQGFEENKLQLRFKIGF